MLEGVVIRNNNLSIWSSTKEGLLLFDDKIAVSFRWKAAVVHVSNGTEMNELVFDKVEIIVGKWDTLFTIIFSLCKCVINRLLPKSRQTLELW